MNKTYCDHCKKELKTEDKFFSVDVCYRYFPTEKGFVRPMDLCIDCQAKFKKLLKDFIGVEE